MAHAFILLCLLLGLSACAHNDHEQDLYKIVPKDCLSNVYS